MTTYQEPPLQSRRAARHGERADAAAAPVLSNESAERAVAAGTAEPLNYATTSRPPLPQYDGQNLRPRRTVESPDREARPSADPLSSQDAPSYRPRDFSPEARRAEPTWAPQYGGVSDDGNVEFQTQAHASVPVDVAQVAREQAPADTGLDRGALASLGEHTVTRRELRALRQAGLMTDVTDLSQPIDLPPSVIRSLEPIAAEAPEPVVAEPGAADTVVAEPGAADTVVAGTGAADAAAFQPEAAAAVAPFAEPIPLVPPAPQPSSRLDSALAEFDALAAGREPLIQELDAPVPLPGRRAAGPRESDVAFDAPSAPPEQIQAPVATPLPPSTEGLSAFDALFQPPSTAVPVVVALPVDQNAVHHDVVEAEIIEPAPSSPASSMLIAPPHDLFGGPAPQGAPAPVPPPAPFISHAPDPVVGHWSTQSDIDDAEQINESAISRSVGTGNGAITTSALVLPSVPDHISGPLGDSGQIMLTGSISLPDSLSMSGALPSQLDEVDIDHRLDPGDHQVASTDSTPVSAIRAVSTHTASGGIVTPTKPKGTRGFTILIIAASTMAVVVVGLLIAGLVSGTL
jgi:hypothetical protein